MTFCTSLTTNTDKKYITKCSLKVFFAQTSKRSMLAAFGILNRAILFFFCLDTESCRTHMTAARSVAHFTACLQVQFIFSCDQGAILQEPILALPQAYLTPFEMLTLSHGKLQPTVIVACSFYWLYKNATEKMSIAELKNGSMATPFILLMRFIFILRVSLICSVILIF